MQKHLKWFPLLCAVLVTGILACLIFIAYRLLNWPDMAVHAGAQLVWEGISHALI